MADIVSFPAPKPKDEDKVLWRCNCGCVSFLARGDDELECCQCGALVSEAVGGEWRKKLPETKTDAPELGAGDVTVADLNESGAALRRTLDKAEPGTTAMVIVIQQDGGVSTWGSYIETEEQAEWFDRRAATAKTMLTKRSFT